MLTIGVEIVGGGGESGQGVYTKCISIDIIRPSLIF